MLSITEKAPVLSDPGSIWRGIALALAINMAALLLGFITILVFIGAIIIAGFGAIQFAWIMPLYHSHRAKGETETAKGILMGAGVTVLLSAGCWGLLIFPRR